jgi:hypothetical protein
MSGWLFVDVLGCSMSDTRLWSRNRDARQLDLCPISIGTL